MQFPLVPADSVGWLTPAQMREVDRVMVDDLGIQIIQIMENAGLNLARLALSRYETTSPVVVVGSGGNGGGGLVAARHLAVAGQGVRVLLASPRDSFKALSAHQFDIVDRMGIPIVTEVPDDADLFIDAVIGFSLTGPPQGRAGEVIFAMDAAPIPVLSLDTPSGLDPATGTAFDPYVGADATLTLALPKVGLRTHHAVGDLFVANLSIPNSIYESMGVGPGPDFSESTIIELLL